MRKRERERERKREREIEREREEGDCNTLLVFPLELAIVTRAAQ